MVELEYQDVIQALVLMVVEEEDLQMCPLFQDHVIVVAVVAVVTVVVIMEEMVVQESSW